MHVIYNLETLIYRLYVISEFNNSFHKLVLLLNLFDFSKMGLDHINFSSYMNS